MERLASVPNFEEIGAAPVDRWLRLSPVTSKRNNSIGGTGRQESVAELGRDATVPDENYRFCIR